MPPLGKHSYPGRPDRGVYESVESPGNGDRPEAGSEACDPVESDRCEGASNKPDSIAVNFGDPTVREVAESKTPEQAGIDYSDLDMGEVELFTDNGSGGPVVEPAHVDEQIERRVTEEDAVSPALEFRITALRALGDGSHGSTL